ncbi:hypothetical protein Pelo_2084 [Pelomyxa schiedti]|nr:hypothetical protein Pelo_2084 [Pelomyxa schiedti]
MHNMNTQSPNPLLLIMALMELRMLKLKLMVIVITLLMMMDSTELVPQLMLTLVLQQHKVLLPVVTMLSPMVVVDDKDEVVVDEQEDNSEDEEEEEKGDHCTRKDTNAIEVWKLKEISPRQLAVRRFMGWRHRNKDLVKASIINKAHVREPEIEKCDKHHLAMIIFKSEREAKVAEECLPDLNMHRIRITAPRQTLGEYEEQVRDVNTASPLLETSVVAPQESGQGETASNTVVETHQGRRKYWSEGIEDVEPAEITKIKLLGSGSRSV